MTWFLGGLFVLAIVGYVVGKIERDEEGAVVHLGKWGWIVVGGAIAVLIVSLASAHAADPTDCKGLGKQVGDVVLAATDDTDLSQAVAASTEAHCILVDEPPVVVRVEPPAGTAPAAGDPSGVPEASKTKWCKAHFGSYKADGTVLRRRGGSRVPCPFPG